MLVQGGVVKKQYLRWSPGLWQYSKIVQDLNNKHTTDPWISWSFELESSLGDCAILSLLLGVGVLRAARTPGYSCLFKYGKNLFLFWLVWNIGRNSRNLLALRWDWGDRRCGSLCLASHHFSGPWSHSLLLPDLVETSCKPQLPGVSPVQMCLPCVPFPFLGQVS